jgi:hypothetical protein
MPDARGGYGSERHTKILRACEKHWDAHKDDCSGFVKAVAAELGIALTGQANDIYEQIQRSPWSVIARGKRGGEHAATAGIAAGYGGKFVVGASRNSSGHGHVAVIVEHSGAGAMSVKSARGTHCSERSCGRILGAPEQCRGCLSGDYEILVGYR